MARRKRFTAPPTSKTSLVQNTKSWPVHVSFERRSSKKKKSYILLQPGEVLNCSMLVTTKWIAILIPAQYCSKIEQTITLCRENAHKKVNKILCSQLNYLFLLCCQHVMYLWTVSKKVFFTRLNLYTR